MSNTAIASLVYAEDLINTNVKEEEKITDINDLIWNPKSYSSLNHTKDENYSAYVAGFRGMLQLEEFMKEKTYNNFHLGDYSDFLEGMGFKVGDKETGWMSYCYILPENIQFYIDYMKWDEEEEETKGAHFYAARETFGDLQEKVQGYDCELSHNCKTISEFVEKFASTEQ